jgi:transforming growth factor-beta-induced protein
VFANPSVLAGILTYHVVPGAVLSTDLVENTTVTTVNGADLEIEISLDGTTITINDATVVAADLMPLNGVIHVIDELLLPPDFAIPSDIVTTAVQSGSFPALVAALAAADLVDALAYPGGPYTVCK